MNYVFFTDYTLFMKKNTSCLSNELHNFKGK